MNSVGERLKQARTERGMTQAVLAQGLATKGFISLVERDLANCSLPKLRLFADRLGRPLSYFLPEAPSEDIQYLSKTAELALRAGETRQALKAIQEGLQLEITASVRAGLLRLRGMALFAMGRWEKALGELQAAAAIAPADDPELTAAIYTEMGAVLGSQERYTASIEANMRALSSLDRSKHADPDLRARVLTNLANDSYHLGQLSDATTYLERALRVAMDAESLVRMANAHMALGITARASGDFEVALKHCDRALAIHHLLGHEQIANHILNNLADVHFAAGRLDEARRYQQACLDRGRQSNDVVAIAAAACELARYALTDGRLDDALRLARDGQDAARRARDHLREATALSLEATVIERRGDRRQADALFGQALRLLDDRKAAAKLAELCARYSEILEARGDRDSALMFMRMAYERNFQTLPALLGTRRQKRRA